MGRQRGWARLGTGVVALAAATVLVVSGCSSGSGSSSGGVSAANASGGSAAGGGAASKADGGVAAGESGVDLVHGQRAQQAREAEPAQARRIARDAGVTIRVPGIRKAANEVRQVAAREQGYVQSEQIGDGGFHPYPAEGDGGTPSSGNDFGGEASLTLSVPAEHLDATLRRLADVGTVTDQWITSEDVTSRYVDTRSRLATQRKSVERVRALMDRATRIKDVVTIENELREREATLESLEAQLADLEDNVARSTVEVSLSTTATPAPEPASFPNGFVQGLATGWHGFVTAVSVVVTALGVALPFLVLGAIVLVPLAWWWRRRRGAGSAAATTS